MSQPQWKLIANLGDVNPLDYGGFFVYRDETGVYEEEAELLLVDDQVLLRAEEDDLAKEEGRLEDLKGEEAKPYTVYRFAVGRCWLTATVLSDNKYHPELPAWFAQPEHMRSERPQDTTYFRNVTRFAGFDYGDAVTAICSDDPLRRAWVWKAIGEFHGFENLDSYPLRLTRSEAKERYKEKASA
jgi:hypothetical protein